MSDLEEKSIQIVEWMEGWEIKPAYKGYAIEEGGVAKTSLDMFCHSLEVIRKVEEAVINERLQEIYADVLYRMAFGAEGFQGDYQEFNHYSLIELATADPKTRLKDLHRTLDEAGLLSGDD